MKNERIKDSGSTQEFGNGAHRDNAKGKGRADLLPHIETSMAMLNDPVMYNIGQFMTSRDPKYLADAIKSSVETIPMFHYSNMVKSMMDEGIDMHIIDENEPNAKNLMLSACIAHMMLESSKLYEAGADKYGANNWKLGMPVNRYIDSGTRHYLKTVRGDIDEPHYRGFVWNLLCAMWTCNNHPDLNFEEKPVVPNK